MVDFWEHEELFVDWPHDDATISDQFIRKVIDEKIEEIRQRHPKGIENWMYLSLQNHVTTTIITSNKLSQEDLDQRSPEWWYPRALSLIQEIASQYPEWKFVAAHMTQR